MRLSRAVVGMGTLLIGVGATVAIGDRRHRQWSARRAASLRNLAGTVRTERDESVEDHSLPEPVERYVAHVLPPDRHPTGVRVDQRGDIRLGEQSSDWHSFTATHQLVTRPPGFLWDARVGLIPGVWVTVADEYRRGTGTTRVRLLSTIPIGRSESSPELNEASLMRYLAEGPWCPSSLLPAAGVSWEPIDGRSARASIRDGTTEASLVFHFTEDDVVERVTTDARFRKVAGGFEPTPWSGHWGSYRTIDGIRVPTDAEVVWHLPDGDLHAWRATVGAVEFFD